MVKILHTGDFHLDSPHTSLDLPSAEAARERQREAFEAMMGYAAENEIGLVLICGDLFDTKYITARTRDLVCRAFESLPCPVVIAPGNHDPYGALPLYREGVLPENVYVFSSEEMQIFDFDNIGISVCGYAFLSDRLDSSPLRDFSLVAERIRVEKGHKLLLCAHADLYTPMSKYAPTTPSEIERCSFAYAALGHIHNPPESASDVIRYCGFPEGRGFDELGYGGAYVVTLDSDQTKVERINLSSHRYLVSELDVSGAQSDAEIERKILDHIDSTGYGHETSLSLSLIGTVSPDCVASEKKLASPLSKTELCELEIKNKTAPLQSTESLLRDPTLRGELYRTLLPRLESDDANERKLAAEALRLGLYAIDGGSVSELLGIGETRGAK